MPRLISDSYQKLNYELHRSDPGFGTHAASIAQAVAETARAQNCTTLLDYGCGKGTLKPALAKIAPHLIVSEYDPAIPGKGTLQSRAIS